MLWGLVEEEHEDIAQPRAYPHHLVTLPQRWILGCQHAVGQEAAVAAVNRGPEVRCWNMARLGPLNERGQRQLLDLTLQLPGDVLSAALSVAAPDHTRHAVRSFDAFVTVPGAPWSLDWRVESSASSRT